MRTNICNLLDEKDNASLDRIKDLPIVFLKGQKFILKKITKPGEIIPFISLYPEKGKAPCLCVQDISKKYKFNFMPAENNYPSYLRVYHNFKGHVVDIYNEEIKENLEVVPLKDLIYTPIKAHSFLNNIQAFLLSK